MWLRVYFTISQIEGSENINTFPTACSTDGSCNASVCWKFIWEESFLLGNGFAVSNALLLVQDLLHKCALKHIKYSQERVEIFILTCLGTVQEKRVREGRKGARKCQSNSLSQCKMALSDRVIQSVCSAWTHAHIK